MGPSRAARLAILILLLAPIVAVGCSAEDEVMTPKSLRMTYGGDQATYERLQSITDCAELADVLAWRSRDYVRQGDRSDLGIERAARQQLRANGCEIPAS